MAKHHSCDLHGDRLIEPEVSTIRITGPLASILNRRELHVGKPGAYDLAEFFGFVVARPEGLASIMADRRKPEAPGADPFAVDVSRPEPALVVRPPKGRGAQGKGRKSSAFGGPARDGG